MYLATVSEAGGVLNFDEAGIQFMDLAADTLYCRSDIRPISIVPSPRDKPHVMKAVVDGAVGHVAASVRRQQMDDVVFPPGEADVPVVPIGPVDARPEDEPAEGYDVVRPGISRRLESLDHALETPAKNAHAPPLAHKVAPPLAHA